MTVPECFLHWKQEAIAHGAFDKDTNFNRAFELLNQCASIEQSVIAPFCTVYSISELVGNHEPREIKLLLTDIIKTVLLNSILDGTRRVWLLGCHEGSQQQELRAYELLVAATTRAIQREQTEIDD